MSARYLTLISTLAVFLATGSLSSAQAPQHGPVELPSVAHAVSAPLRSFTPISNKKIFGPARVIPLHRPEDTGLETNGGGGEAGPAAPTVGNWADADVQTTYNPSQLTLQNVFGGIGFTGKIPPDENLSVGINTTGGSPQTQVVQTVNTAFTIYTPSGSGVANGYLSGLFANLTNSLCSSVDGGDPIVLFDKLDGRWIISQLAYDSTFTDNHLCLAISQTSDAGGVYDAYDFPFGSNLPDYPKLAIWPDGIYFSANIYASNGTTQQFTGAQACSFPRSYVTSPPPSGNISFSCSPANDAGIYNILPADLENPPGTASLPSGHDYYLQYVDNLGPGSGNVLRLYQFDPAAGSLNTVSNLTVNDFHDACGGGTCIPQEGTTQLLDSLGDRLMYRLSYRVYDTYSQIVANHSVQINSSDNQTGIRWYALRSDQGGPFYVDKESTFSPDASTYRWMGSIAQNKHGDLGLEYSTSGVTSVPGISVTGVLNGTDSGMELGQSVYNGSDRSYQGTYSRWGDYSSISVDPTDDCSFWYTNEYVKTPVLSFDFLWNTIIGKFSVGDCSGSTSSTFSFSVVAPSSQTTTPGGSAPYTITVTPASGYNGIVNLSVDQNTCPSGATCTLSTTTANFSTSTTPVNTTLTVDTGSSTPAQSYNIVVKGTDASDSSITGQTSVQLAVTDFSVSANPSSQTVTSGTDAVYTITANALNGFTGTVNLSVGSTCPSGLVCAFGSTSIAAGSSTTLTVSGTDSVQSSSTFSITVTGTTSSGLTHTANASLTVNPPPPDFSISATPGSETVTAGTSATYTVSITSLNGFTGSVNLNVSGFPSGATASFSSNPTISSSTLTISTGGTTPSGTYPLTITGTYTDTNGTLTHTTTVDLTVNGTSSGDFSLSPSPTSQSVTQGSGTSYSVTVSASGGFSGTVGFSVGGLPTGAGASFSPSSVTGSGSTTMNVTTSGTTPTGTYTLTITGTSGSLTHTATVSLIINPPPDFTLSADSATITVPVNSSNTDTITVTPSGGFTGSVSLSLSGLPRRTSSSFSVNPLSITSSPGSSILTISTNRNTTTGTYGLALTATSGGLTHTINLMLVVGTTSSPDFSISASPSSQTVDPGSGTSYAVNIAGSGGFTDTVGLSVSSSLPGGVTANFTPTSVSGGTGSSTMSVTTSASTPTGTYTITITGTSSSVTHSTTVMLVVGTAAGGDFSLSASPGSTTLRGGGTATYTISVTPASGANPTVGFQVTGLPGGGTTAGFNPTSVTGSGSTTLSVLVPSGVTGNYTLTVIGTNGQGTSHTVSVGLKLH